MSGNKRGSKRIRDDTDDGENGMSAGDGMVLNVISQAAGVRGVGGGGDAVSGAVSGNGGGWGGFATNWTDAQNGMMSNNGNNTFNGSGSKPGSAGKGGRKSRGGEKKKRRSEGEASVEKTEGDDADADDEYQALDYQDPFEDEFDEEPEVQNFVSRRAGVANVAPDALIAASGSLTESLGALDLAEKFVPDELADAEDAQAATTMDPDAVVDDGDVYEAFPDGSLMLRGNTVTGTAQEEDEEDYEDVTEQDPGHDVLGPQPGVQTWVPGMDVGEEDDGELEFSNSAYDMFHRLRPEWPCLSFDVIRDGLGYNRTRFPMTGYFAAGSQADRPSSNRLYVIKVSEMHRTKYDSDEEVEDEDDEEGGFGRRGRTGRDDDALVEFEAFRHEGGINRVRSCPQQPWYISTWGETGHVSIYDVREALQILEGGGTGAADRGPVFASNHHASEGWAMDWSTQAPGYLLTGDCKGNIHQWMPKDGLWAVDMTPFHGHEDSVEDVQWSPDNQFHFASVSVDRSLRFWDTRKRGKSLVVADAHEQDVNVLSWNKTDPTQLLTGGDDGIVKIWDKRRAKTPLQTYAWHKGPIYGVEWSPQPNDATVFAVSSGDDTVTIWDSSVEDSHGEATGLPSAIPPQLLFIHMGQKDTKEVHWHPQQPGVVYTTAGDGFNVWKGENM